MLVAAEGDCVVVVCGGLVLASAGSKRRGSVPNSCGFGGGLGVPLTDLEGRGLGVCVRFFCGVGFGSHSASYGFC